MTSLNWDSLCQLLLDDHNNTRIIYTENPSEKIKGYKSRWKEFVQQKTAIILELGSDPNYFDFKKDFKVSIFTCFTYQTVLKRELTLYNFYN